MSAKPVGFLGLKAIVHGWFCLLPSHQLVRIKMLVVRLKISAATKSELPANILGFRF